VEVIGIDDCQGRNLLPRIQPVSCWPGIAFSDRMLHWPKGPRDSDGIWAPHWYAHVWESTGFELPVAHDVALSGEAAAVAEARWPHYEQLRALRVIVGN